MAPSQSSTQDSAWASPELVTPEKLLWLRCMDTDKEKPLMGAEQSAYSIFKKALTFSSYQAGEVNHRLFLRHLCQQDVGRVIYEGQTLI